MKGREKIRSDKLILKVWSSHRDQIHQMTANPLNPFQLKYLNGYGGGGGQGWMRGGQGEGRHIVEAGGEKIRGSLHTSSAYCHS
jgi:hypothetical protein